jgi:hypothetical protein
MSLTPAVPPTLTLTAGEERTLTVSFAAQTAGTSHAATWTITCNDALLDSDHFELTAVGTVGPASGGGGVPTWVWFAIAGGVVVAAAVVIVVVASDDD